MSAENQRAWDAYDVYLFDVDGTLLKCADAVHYFAFCDTLTMLAGRPLDLNGVIAHGNTDVGILRDALTLANVPEEAWRPRLQGARDAMCRYVGHNKENFRIQSLPGVERSLEYLRNKGAVLGVATGNLQCIGRMKLAACGLLQYFNCGSYSDAYEYRKDVFAAALTNARAMAGEDATVCVVGDTPADIQAAHANGMDVIAVATGIYSREHLLAENPTRCLVSFEDLAHLIDQG